MNMAKVVAVRSQVEKFVTHIEAGDERAHDQLVKLVEAAGPGHEEIVRDLLDRAAAAHDRLQAQAAEVTADPREVAARTVAALGFEGCGDVVAALRGQMAPKLGAETLIAALRDRRVPGDLKADGGPIREAIASAWAAHNAAQAERREALAAEKERREAALAAQPAQALRAFAEFLTELREISRRLPGYATEQKLRGSSARFYRANEGLPLLVKVMEDLIVAKEGNEINSQLRTDPELAAVVAAAPEGLRAGALLRALQARAAEAVAANGRRRNGGKFGRQDGAPASHEARDAARHARQLERAAAQTPKAGGRSWSKPKGGGK